MGPMVAGEEVDDANAEIDPALVAAVAAEVCEGTEHERDGGCNGILECCK